MVKNKAKKVLVDYFFKRFGLTFREVSMIMWGKCPGGIAEVNATVKPIADKFDAQMNEWGYLSTREQEFLSTSVLSKGVLSERLRVVAMLAVLDIFELKRIRQEEIERRERLMIK